MLHFATSKHNKQLGFRVPLMDGDKLENVHRDLALLARDEFAVVSKHFDETVVRVGCPVHIDLHSGYQLDGPRSQTVQAPPRSEELDNCQLGLCILMRT